MTSAISLTDVERARERIAGLVDPSPVIRSPRLSAAAGRAGMAQARVPPAAWARSRSAAPLARSSRWPERQHGVIACSGGNHGAAVAYVAHLLGIPATICVPETVGPVKLRLDPRQRRRGGRGGRHLRRRRPRCPSGWPRERGLSFVHPFDDPDVIAGQGTIGLELLEQVPGLAAAVAGVSGGGLAAGWVRRSREPGRRCGVIGVSAQNAAAMVASLRAGHPVNVPHLDTLAEVLGGGIGLDNHWSMNAVREFVDEHVLVHRGGDLRRRWCSSWPRNRVVAEGGGAVGTAAALAASSPRRTARWPSWSAAATPIRPRSWRWPPRHQWPDVISGPRRPRRHPGAARRTDNPQVTSLGRLGLAGEQTWVQFLGHHRVHAAVHQPVDQRHDHRGVDVGAHLTTVDAELDERAGPVGVLADQVLGDPALELEVGAVVAEQRHAVGHPVLADELGVFSSQ